jgi:aldose 1-epimerase
MIPAEKYFPLNELLLPLGEIGDVADTSRDFRKPRAIGEDHDNAFLLAGLGRHGPLERSTAFAIEPQNVADAPNHPAFPSSILRPSEVYRNRMEWRFS